MNVEKAAYWLALAAFGFALHGVCPRGTLQNLNHALSHTGSTLGRLAMNAERAVIASALIGHPPAGNSWSTPAAPAAPAATELAQQKTEQAQDQIERVQNQIEQAEQTRDQVLAQADALREEALAKADATRQEALAKAVAMREEALAQAAIARAEVEMKRAEIAQLRVRMRPQVHFSRAANQHVLAISADPCDYSRSSDAVAAIDLSDDEQ